MFNKTLQYQIKPKLISQFRSSFMLMDGKTGEAILTDGRQVC
jgi:hypothetical protein